MAAFGDGEAAVRALSVLIGAPVALVTWLFGRRLVGPGAALFAAGLVAVAPSQIAAGQEARMYALLTLTALASWWALWAALAGGRRRAWIAVVGLTAVAALAVAAVRGSLGLNVYAPRYQLFIVPPVALLVAAGAAALAAGPRRLLRAAGLLLPIFVLIPNAAGTMAFHGQPLLDVFDWRLVSRTLAAQARPDDAIAFLRGFSRIPVNYYFRDPQVRLALTQAGTDVAGEGGTRAP